jgi:outer membrane protein assembly factor BamB
VVSAIDGKEIRKIPMGAQVGATPLVFNDRAYLGTYGNRFLSVDLQQGKTLWEYRDQAFPFFSSAAHGKGTLFFGSRDKKVHAVNFGDGKIRWTFTTRGQVDGSPVFCDGKVLVGSMDGRLYMLRAKDGEDLWSWDLGAAIQATPAIWNAMVVIGAADGAVHAFGPEHTPPRTRTPEIKPNP